MRLEKSHFSRIVKYAIFLYVTGTLYVLVNRDLPKPPSEADWGLNSRDSLDSESPADNVISSTTWVNSKQKQTALWINSIGNALTMDLKPITSISNISLLARRERNAT